MVLQRGLGKRLAGWIGGLICIVSPMTASAQGAPVISGGQIGWTEFHSTPGNCSMQFPANPEHISEKMVMPDQGFELKYDAYISAADQKTVFMLLIAQYPEFVDQTYAQMSLEGFLNGILTHNPGNQLLFADLVLVEGFEGLDFFIKTGNVYFKGRAVMVRNSLYLMAMECDIPSYDEIRYSQFVNSFKLHSKQTAKK